MTWPSVIQALSYAAHAVIALLTFLRARKTLLMPLRTEVFKLQVDELRAILGILRTKDEIELRADLGFNQLLYANAARLYDRFARDVFGFEINEIGKPYGIEACGHTVAQTPLMKPKLEGAGPHYFPGQRVQIFSSKPATREDARDWWSAYLCDELRLPNSMTQVQKQLAAASTSPLLPSAIARELDNLIAAIAANRDLLFDTLTIAGRSLPDRHPDAEPPTSVRELRSS